MRGEPPLRYRHTMHGPAPSKTPLAGTRDTAPAADLAEAVGQLRRGAVLVVGDAMLDRYVYGRVARVSPEAPVPVLTVEREVALPGGAGNVVRNLTALGAAVAFVSVVGDDQAGSDLTGLIGGQPGVDPWLLVEGGRATTTKTRFVAVGQQLLRADHEIISAIHPRLADRMVKIAADAVAKAAPDGHTLLLARTASSAILPATDPRTPYAWDEFTVLGLLHETPFVVCVRADAPWASLGELLNALREAPGRLTFATSGPATVLDLGVRQLFVSSGLPIDAGNALVEAIKNLPEREQYVMSMYYEHDMNLKEIAAVLGVTESRVCQLHSQSIARLRTRLREW